MRILVEMVTLAAGLTTIGGYAARFLLGHMKINNLEKLREDRLQRKRELEEIHEYNSELDDEINRIQIELDKQKRKG